jgi:signal transduction histidine kinase
MIKTYRCRLTATILKSLLMFALLLVLVLVGVALLVPLSPGLREEMWDTTVQTLVTAGVLAHLWWLLKTVDGDWVQPTISWLLIVYLIVLLSIADEPQEVVVGHTQFIFVLPIFLGGILLCPRCAFIAWAMVSIAISTISVLFLEIFPLLPIAELGVMAMLAWVLGKSIQHALEREAKLDKARLTFIQVAAHELRTPLYAVRNYAAMMNEDNSAKAQRLCYNVRALQSHVDSLLRALEVAAGYTPSVEKFAIRKMLHNKVVRETVASSRVTVDIEPDLVVSTDPRAFATILHHLVDNALKHSDGVVDVGIVRHTKLILTVSGVGINSAGLAPFAVEEVGRGLGLDLYIVQGFVEALEGQITTGDNEVKVILPVGA